MKRRDALALTATAPLAGCGLARYARSLVEGCPAVQLPPLEGRIETRLVNASLASKYVSEPIGLFALETALPIKRIVWALPGRGAGAYSQQLFLRPYIRALGIKGVAILSIDGGESYWHPRAPGEDRLAMLFEDAVPWARKRYNTNAAMGIIGWSMGGYGAINAGEQRRELFDRVCGVSPALWQNAREQHSAVPDAFDDAQSFNRYDVFAHAPALRASRVRLSCGSKDPFYSNTVAFAQTLRRDGVSVETDFFEHGCHDTASWQRTLLADLTFVLDGAR